MPRSEGLRLERAMRESSLLLVVDAVLGDRSPFDVPGRELVSCAEFCRRSVDRRIHDGDSLLIDVGSVDIMTSDMRPDV